jgi:hypothetical protein
MENKAIYIMVVFSSKKIGVTRTKSMLSKYKHKNVSKHLITILLMQSCSFSIAIVIVGEHGSILVKMHAYMFNNTREKS